MALRRAAASEPEQPPDVRLASLLNEVDHRQNLWLVVSFNKMGAIGRLKNLGLELVLRPLLRDAESLHGGVECNADEVRAEFVFRAHGEEAAVELEGALQSSCQVAAGARLLPGIDPDLLPVFDLFGTGTTSRDGVTVVVRCRLPADRLAP
jgi:hypothetical protein